jgi:hypothetical protein
MTHQTLLGDSERTRRTRRWRAVAPLVGVAACLVGAAVVINPFGNALPADDAWAYARSVEQLIRTGEYRLDEWSAANMPAQIYLAGAFSKVFGYSLDLMKIITGGCWRSVWLASTGSRAS